MCQCVCMEESLVISNLTIIVFYIGYVYNLCKYNIFYIDYAYNWCKYKIYCIGYAYN